MTVDMGAMFAPSLLAGKVAVVTGGGSGIGFVIARALGQVGAEVVLAARTKDRLADACDALALEGIAASWRQLDIRDATQVGEVIDDLVTTHGRIDILVNNAGGQFPVKAEQLSPNGWRSVVDLNLNGSFHCTSAVGRHMIADGKGGKILSIVFNTLDRPIPGNVHSAAARAGVMAMTRTLAVEWARFGVQINALGPLFLSEAAQAAYGEHVDEVVTSNTPMGRWASAQELATWAVILASPATDYVTGVTFPLDGGNWLGGGLRWRDTPVLPE
jgi:citronellol/citronellal dehydrogenase